ncbi:MAG: protein translocase subunit SecF [Elusimicrobiota bacterium]
MRILSDTHIDFLSKRKVAFFVSVLLVILSIIHVALKSPNWGIDFTGGSLVHIKFEKAPSSGDLRNILEKEGFVDNNIQQFKNEQIAIIRVRSQEDGVVDKIEQSFRKNLEDKEFTVLRSETVGPAVGGYLREKAIKAFLFAFLGIIIYVAWRFKGGVWGLAAVIALIHDVIITFGVLSFTGVTINLPVVAALLTLAGYSINDSIVVYDRIRENRKLKYKSSFFDVINISINDTLSRTIVTSGTTLVVVLALFFKGGEVLHGFSVALLSGIIVGTYSSVYVASPLVYAWQSKKKQ